MKSAPAPRHGRLYRRMAADAAVLEPRPGPAPAAAVTEVTARVLVDARGAPVEFSTDDRWCILPDGLVRTRWSTPVQGWMKINGRWQPRWGAAIWHLPGGPFCYAEFRPTPGAVRYNVTPAELSPGEPGRPLPGDDVIPDPVAISGSMP